MSSNNKARVLDGETVSVPFWKRLLGIEKDGKKLAIQPKTFSITVGIFVAVVLVIQMVLDGTKETPAAAINPTDPGSPSTAVAQLITVPQEDLRKESSVGQRHVSGQGGRAKFSGPELLLRPIDLGKIPPGTLFWAKLTGGASNGPVRAEVTKELAVNGEPKIPSGAVLVGSGSSSEERLKVNFDQVVFKDGTIAQFSAVACDKSDKIPGLKGSLVGNKALNIAGSIGLGFIGGFSEGLQETQGQQGAVVRKASIKNALLNATATTALEQSQNLMSDLKSRTPIIEVPEGTDICVIAVGGNGQ